MIEDKEAIAQVRKQWCEWCGRVGVALEVHHLWKKGMGGGKRLDIPENLVTLCAGWGSSWCHKKADEGLIPRTALVLLVAKRENTTSEAIEEKVNRLLWGRRDAAV